MALRRLWALGLLFSLISLTHFTGCELLEGAEELPVDAPDRTYLPGLAATDADRQSRVFEFPIVNHTVGADDYFVVHSPHTYESTTVHADLGGHEATAELLSADDGALRWFHGTIAAEGLFASDIALSETNWDVLVNSFGEGLNGQSFNVRTMTGTRTEEDVVVLDAIYDGAVADQPVEIAIRFRLIDPLAVVSGAVYPADRRITSELLQAHFEEMHPTGGWAGQTQPDLWEPNAQLADEFPVTSDESIMGEIFEAEDVMLDWQSPEYPQLITRRSSRPADAPVSNVQLSADGNIIVFQTASVNLVSQRPSGGEQIFVLDRQAEELSLLSISMDDDPDEQIGLNATRPSVSADGRYIALETNDPVPDFFDRNRVRDIYLYDRSADAYELISREANGRAADGPSFSPAISGDGSIVAFVSDATNLFVDDSEPEDEERNEGDDQDDEDELSVDAATNATASIYVWTRGSDGLRRLDTTTALPSLDSDADLAMSGDGSRLAYYSITGDVVVVEIESGEVTFIDARLPHLLVSSPSLSEDGRFVAFVSHHSHDPRHETPWLAVYRHDLEEDTTELASLDNRARFAALGMNRDATMSGDGRFVAFASNSLVLLPFPFQPPTHYVVRDMVQDTTAVVSLTADRRLRSEPATRGVIAAEAPVIAFIAPVHDNEEGIRTSDHAQVWLTTFEIPE